MTSFALKNILPITIVLLVILSCNKEVSSGVKESGSNNLSEQNQQAASNLNKLASYMDSSLGEGYNSLLSMNTNGFCLGNVAAKFIPKRNVTISFDKVDSLMKLVNSNKFGFSGSAGVSTLLSGFLGGVSNNLPGVNATVNFGLSSAFNFDNYSTNMLMTVQNFAGTRQMTIADNTNPYYVIKQPYENLSTSQFANLCGDSVITEQNAESNLYFALKFSFANTTTRNSFNLGFGASANIPIHASGATASLSYDTMFGNVNQTTRANTNLTVYAIQVGGDGTKLPTALANGQSCNLANTQGCSDLLSTINDYITNKYPSQFSEDDISVLASNPSQSRYVLSTSKISQYNQIPIFNNGDFVGQRIYDALNSNIEIKNQIATQTKPQIANYYTVLNLANSMDFKNNVLAPGEINMITTNLTNMNNVFNKLISLVNNCYDSITQCLQNVNNIFTPTSTYQPMDPNVNKIIIGGKLIGRIIKSDTSQSTAAFLTPSQLQAYDTAYVKVVTNNGLVLNLNPIQGLQPDPSTALVNLTCGADSRSQSSGNINFYMKNYISIQAADFVYRSGKDAHDYSNSKICWLESSIFPSFSNSISIEIWGINTFVGL